VLLRKKAVPFWSVLDGPGTPRFATAHELAHFFMHEEADRSCLTKNLNIFSTVWGMKSRAVYVPLAWWAL